MYVNDIDVKIPGIVNEIHIDNTSRPMSVLIVERDIMMGKKNVLFIHHISTKFGKDGFGYGSLLLKKLGDQYKDLPREV